MDVSTMINLLGVRLEDPDEKKFTPSFKTTALNNGQLKVAQRLNRNYLTELQYLDTTKSLGGVGYIALSGLTKGVLNGAEGILKVKVSGTTGKYCTRIDISDLKDTQNTYLQGTVENPLFYIFNNRIYVLPLATVNIDVWYLQAPPSMFYLLNVIAYGGGTTANVEITSGQGTNETDNDTYNGLIMYSNERQSWHIVTDYVAATGQTTVVPASAGFGANTIFFKSNPYDGFDVDGVESTLNQALHENIVTMAEAEAWQMDRKLDRWQAAMSAADAEIKLLNERYVGAQGIGTKGDNR